MTPTTAAGDEYHRRRDRPAKNLTVVTRPTHHPKLAPAPLPDRVVDQIHQRGIHRGRRLVDERRRLDRDLVRLTNRPTALLHQIEDADLSSAVRVAAIDDEARLTGDDVRLIRAYVERAYRRPGRLTHLSRDLADRHDHLGAGQQRIPAHRQGRRPGVVGIAADPYQSSIQPANRLDHTQIEPFAVEDRALLDVELQERAEVTAPRLGDPGRIEADRAHRLGEHHSLDVAVALRLPRLNRPEQRPASPEVADEAAILFLGTHEYLDGIGRPRVATLQGPRRDDRPDDPQSPVELPAGVYRIDVRPDEDDRGSFVTVQASEEVADGIFPDGQPGVLQPAADG